MLCGQTSLSPNLCSWETKGKFRAQDQFSLLPLFCACKQTNVFLITETQFLLLFGLWRSRFASLFLFYNFFSLSLFLSVEGQTTPDLTQIFLWILWRHDATTSRQSSGLTRGRKEKRFSLYFCCFFDRFFLLPCFFLLFNPFFFFFFFFLHVLGGK